jgi:hypothetical protein
MLIPLRTLHVRRTGIELPLASAAHGHIQAGAAATIFEE